MPGDESETPPSWELEYQNAKEALSQQKADLQALANDGQRHLRIAFVFVGFIVSGITYASSVGSIGSLNGCIFGVFGVCVPISIFVDFGVLTLIIGILFLILSSGIESRGTFFINEGREDIERILSEVPSKKEYYRQRLEAYQQRVDHNSNVIHGFETILVMGKSLLAVSVFAFSLSAYRLSIGQPAPELAVTIVAAIFASFWFVSNVMPDEYVEIDRNIFPPK